MVERHRGGELPDARLRAALEPGDDQVVRVVGRAFRALERRRSSRARELVLSAAVVALLILGMLLWPTRPHGPQTPADLAEPRYSMTNENGVFVVRRADGAALIDSREPTDGSPRGMLLIVRGENRP
jgi:hypothetical protein